MVAINKEIVEAYKQEVVTIGDTNVIMIIEDDTRYFPLSYVEQKLLLRQKGSLKNAIREGCSKVFKVNFGLVTGQSNKQNSLCVEIGELKRILLEHTQAARFTTEKRVAQNKLHDYLGIELLPLVEFDLDMFDASLIDNYEEYVKSIIRNVITINPDIKGRACSKCINQYPLHENFFYAEKASAEGLSRICIECKQGNGHKFSRIDDQREKTLRRVKVDENVIAAYRENPIETWYDLYLNGTVSKFPIELRTKENLNIIINKLFKEGLINGENLSVKLLKDRYKINIYAFEKTTIKEIYSWLYGNDFYLEKWKYPLFRNKTEKKDFIKIFDNYLKEHNLIIDDPLNFDYGSVLSKCYMRSEETFGGLVDFLVSYWKGKYAGYHFGNVGNYYRTSDSNVLKDLKFLVENDLVLKREKIPLYITKQSLRNSVSPLYNYIVIKKNGSLFEWFDRLYPNQFDETDFEISKYRNDFDSVEEQQVDGILREYFNNVVYNFNNSDQVVELKGKRPDWFIMREDGVRLVEYFGLYIESQKRNPIVKSYIETTHEKLKLYNELSGYNFLLVYPSDLDNNFFGLRDKIERIVNKDR